MWKKTCEKTCGKKHMWENFLFWKFLPKIDSLCHPSKFPFLVILTQNRSLMSSIKFPFLVIPTKHMSIMSSIKFPFTVIPTKHVSTMSSIKISFYGNPHSTCVTYIIHTNCGVNAHTHLDKAHGCVTTWVRTTVDVIWVLFAKSVDEALPMRVLDLLHICSSDLVNRVRDAGRQQCSTSLRSMVWDWCGHFWVGLQFWACHVHCNWPKRWLRIMDGGQGPHVQEPNGSGPRVEWEAEDFWGKFGVPDIEQSSLSLSPPWLAGLSFTR